MYESNNFTNLIALLASLVTAAALSRTAFNSRRTVAESVAG